jgi:serine/threonine protein kinase
MSEYFADTSKLKYLTSNDNTCVLVYTVPEEQKHKYGNKSEVVIKLQVAVEGGNISEKDIVNELKVLAEVKKLEPLCPFTVGYYGSAFIKASEKAKLKPIVEYINSLNVDKTFMEGFNSAFPEEITDFDDENALSMIVVEFMNGGEFSDHFDMDYYNLKCSLFDISYFMALFHKHTGNMHFDLKRENVLVRKTTAEKKFQIQLKESNISFKSKIQACPYDFGLSVTNVLSEVYTGTPAYKPDYYWMSVTIAFHQRKHTIMSLHQSRAYEDDIWAVGLMLLYTMICNYTGNNTYDPLFELIPVPGTLIRHLKNKMFEIAKRKREFYLALNPPEFSDRNDTFKSTDSFISYFRQTISENVFNFILVKIMLTCLFQKIIGNGFLPDIPNEQSTLHKGLIHEAIQELEHLIIKTLPTDKLEKALFAHGNDCVKFLRKLVAWFPEQRAFFGWQTPGHFANIIKDPFFDELRVSNFESGTNIYNATEDLTPSAKLDFLNPSVLPYLKINKQMRHDTANLIGQSIMKHYKGESKKLWLVKWGDNGYCALIDADTRKPHCNHIVEESKQRHHLTEVYLENRDLCYACDFMK